MAQEAPWNSGALKSYPQSHPPYCFLASFRLLPPPPPPRQRMSHFWSTSKAKGGWYKRGEGLWVRFWGPWLYGENWSPLLGTERRDKWTCQSFLSGKHKTARIGMSFLVSSRCLLSLSLSLCSLIEVSRSIHKLALCLQQLQGAAEERSAILNHLPLKRVSWVEPQC